MQTENNSYDTSDCSETHLVVLDVSSGEISMPSEEIADDNMDRPIERTEPEAGGDTVKDSKNPLTTEGKHLH